LRWNVRSKCCPNVILKWLQWLVWSSFRHVSMLLSGSCNRLGSRRRVWILILKTRLLILPNTRRPSLSNWRMNTGRNIEDCRSLSQITHWTTIPAPSKWLLGLVNVLMIQTIYPGMAMNI
jgi:hypothetical protein